MRTAEQAVLERPRIDYEQRRYNDTVTWLAEVLPGSMRTPFEYHFDGGELFAEDGSPLGEIFDDSIRHAEADHGKESFQYRRVLIEKEEYQDMVRMMTSDRFNTMVIVSDFPAELRHATKDLDGYNVTRQQTMLRVLTKTPQGTLKMYSQSLDKSERTALEALYRHLGFRAQPGELLGQRMNLTLDNVNQEFLIDELTGVYDRQLARQYGGTWYAGRPGVQRNTYDFVCQQQDLLRAYLATTSDFTGGMKDYNLAAAMEARYLATEQPVGFQPASETGRPGIVVHMLALQEMEEAGRRAQASGKAYSGCGLTTEGIQNIESAKDQLAEAGYAMKSSEASGPDGLGPLTFRCKYGHWNKRPKGKLLTACQTKGCKPGSVGC